MNWNRILLASIFLATISCSAQDKSPYVARHPEQVKAYWYAGLAELNRYELTQSRYGEERNGDVVLIYVTEDFLIDDQVKKEFGDGDALSVLKLNKIKRFTTGIYDYSIMTSTFTPMDYMKSPATLKVTFSSQDWCGQSLGQMNLKEGQLQFESRSYFQAEGDEQINIKATYTEEDIWTRARIEPQMLPLGKIDMVPSFEFSRLNHKEIKAYPAVATLVLQINDSEENKEFYLYKLEYPDFNRTLTLKIQSSFPYKIFEWTEELGDKKTTATLTHTEKRAYWSENGNEDEPLRKKLGLD